MKRITLIVFCLALAAVAYGYLGKSAVVLTDLPPPAPGFEPRQVPDDWQAEFKKRSDTKAVYLAQKDIAANWFENFPFSKSDGIPYIILRLLPVIAPEIWGQDADFGTSFGLFARNDGTGLALPVGIGMSGLDPNRATATDFTSFTCGACHIGRVDLGAGQMSPIWGGVNAEFNITKFFIDFEKTLDLMAQGAKGPARAAKIRDVIRAELEKIAATTPTYLYRNAHFGDIICYLFNDKDNKK